jgi:hypothetical protein
MSLRTGGGWGKHKHKPDILRSICPLQFEEKRKTLPDITFSFVYFPSLAEN